MKQRKVPLRKCTGCQEMKNKKDLVRIVRTGKKPGRGAYLCKDTACLEKAQKGKGLERSFKSPVPKEVYDTLRAELEEMAHE